MALAENAHGPALPVTMAMLLSAVDALAGSGRAARAVAFAERALAIASTQGPWITARAELALSRALAAEGEDRGAIAMAQSARALLEGKGYRRTSREIGAWLERLGRSSR